MAGKKRTINGKVKPPVAPQQATEATSPCAQPQIPPSTQSEAHGIPQATTLPKDKEIPTKGLPDTGDPKPQPPNSKRPNRSHNKHSKLPKLPPNTTITRRPLLHPAIPTPFASSSSPKTLYITASTPFIPTLKRIRKLLSEISRREKQAASALAKKAHKGPGGGGGGGGGGKLSNADVEMQIADDVAVQKAKRNAGAGGSGEKVYLKATGRAIPRALELGVQFQGGESGEYVVRVETGSVRAVDDVEVSGDAGEDVPETRMRNVSVVTVSIGMV